MPPEIPLYRLAEQRISSATKSTGLAYLLCLFLGGLGLHRFYLGRSASGAAMLALTLLGLVTLRIELGFALLALVAIWDVTDLFRIPAMMDSEHRALRARVTRDMSRPGGPQGPSRRV